MAYLRHLRASEGLLLRDNIGHVQREAPKTARIGRQHQSAVTSWSLHIDYTICLNLEMKLGHHPPDHSLIPISAQQASNPLARALILCNCLNSTISLSRKAKHSRQATARYTCRIRDRRQRRLLGGGEEHLEL